MPTTRHLVLLGVALIAAASLTACVGGLEPTRTTNETSKAPSAEQQPGPTAPAPTKSAATAQDGNPQPDGNRWAIKLASDGVNTDPRSWPDAGKVFSRAEITSVIPSTTDVQVVDCQKGKFIFGPNGGKRTPHHISCSYEITSDLQAYDDEPLRLYVSFSGFFAKDEARDRFEDSKSSQKKISVKYPDQWMDLGKDSYWTGSSSQVYVGNETLGGTFQLGGSGILAGNEDYNATKHKLRDQLEIPFAKIVQSKL